MRSNRIVLDRKPAAPVAKPVTPQDEGPKQTTVRGQVMDPEGTPLPGATVAVNGTSRGTATDEMGVFSIAVAEGQTLRVAMIGMNPVEVPYTGQRTQSDALPESGQT